MKRSITTSPVPTPTTPMSQGTVLQTRASHLGPPCSPNQSFTSRRVNAGDQLSPEMQPSGSPSSPRSLLRRGHVRHRDRRPSSSSLDTPLAHSKSLPSMYSPAASDTVTFYAESPLIGSHGSLFSPEPQQKEVKSILDEDFAPDKARSILPPLSPVKILDAKPLPPPLSHRSTSSMGSLHPDLVDLAGSWPVSPSINQASLPPSHPSRHEEHAPFHASLPLPRNVSPAQPTEQTLIVL